MRATTTALLALLVSSCGVADVPEPTAIDAARTAPANAPPATQPTQPAMLDAAGALCRASDEGSLQARLQGAVDAEIAWTAPGTPQCIGGPRPGGEGLRLVYKGAAGDAALLVIVGVAIAPGSRTARNLPASVTIVREGSGEFFGTQGDDKCAFDEVVQAPVAGHEGRYRLSGRGYCTQPARALGSGMGSILVSRFDVVAVVEYPTEH